MAKQTGLSWTTFSVDDSGGTVRDIRNDCTDISFSTPRGVQEITGLDKAAYERQLLLADAQVTANGVANFGAVPSATAHGVFATVPSTSVARTVTIGIGGKSLPGEYLFTDYSFNRSNTGELTWSAPGVLADGTPPTWA